MKFGVVNKSTTVNGFVVHTLQRNITHLAVITGKSNIKLGILKGGELEKSQLFEFLLTNFPPQFFFYVPVLMVRFFTMFLKKFFDFSTSVERILFIFWA